MSTTTTNTIPTLKTTFLRTQIRLLSLPLVPSPTWRSRAPVPEHGDLKEKLVQEVLSKLLLAEIDVGVVCLIGIVDVDVDVDVGGLVNTIARRHGRAVYSSQAVRCVAEQIDALYWKDAELGREGGESGGEGGESGGEGVVRGVDFSVDGNIANLPEEWPDEGGEDESGLQRFGESKRYQQLQARLVALNAQRQTQKHKLAQYRQLQQMLEPFKNPQVDIQPNLVTRDGELEKELDRMRILIARVSNGMQGREEDGSVGGELEEEEEKSTEEKLAGVLGM
ncbi:MAG: hypothetical protein M1830_002066 [Pleopsidium flavum]|nr:MAG: hypothetical protein M1830_002066 [Pleopsidium flavum]